MKKLLIVVLLFSSLKIKAQCFPNTRWIPSFSFEGTIPFGGIVQGGLFSQVSPFSFQAGVRIRSVMQDSTKAGGNYAQGKDFDIIPRFEFSYRAIGDQNFGIHPFVGISRKPDIGIMANLAASSYASFRTRVAYDGKLFIGMGALFFIP